MQGRCGSCKTALLGGEADHRDALLTARQKAKNDRILVCVSRAKAEGGTLVLDL